MSDLDNWGVQFIDTVQNDLRTIFNRPDNARYEFHDIGIMYIAELVLRGNENRINGGSELFSEFMLQYFEESRARRERKSYDVSGVHGLKMIYNYFLGNKDESIRAIDKIPQSVNKMYSAMKLFKIEIENEPPDYDFLERIRNSVLSDQSAHSMGYAIDFDSMILKRALMDENYEVVGQKKGEILKFLKDYSPDLLDVSGESEFTLNTAYVVDKVSSLFEIEGLGLPLLEEICELVQNPWYKKILLVKLAKKYDESGDFQKKDSTLNTIFEDLVINNSDNDFKMDKFKLIPIKFILSKVYKEHQLLSLDQLNNMTNYLFSIYDEDTSYRNVRLVSRGDNFFDQIFDSYMKRGNLEEAENILNTLEGEIDYLRALDPNAGNVAGIRSKYCTSLTKVDVKKGLERMDSYDFGTEKMTMFAYLLRDNLNDPDVSDQNIMAIIKHIKDMIDDETAPHSVHFINTLIATAGVRFYNNKNFENLMDIYTNLPSVYKVPIILEVVKNQPK